MTNPALGQDKKLGWPVGKKESTVYVEGWSVLGGKIWAEVVLRICCSILLSQWLEFIPQVQDFQTASTKNSISLSLMKDQVQGWRRKGMGMDSSFSAGMLGCLLADIQAPVAAWWMIASSVPHPIPLLRPMHSWLWTPDFSVCIGSI